MNSFAGTALSQLLEQLSNYALKLDPATKSKLKDLDGQCIQINAQSIVYCLLIANENIHIYHNDEFPWNARIKGTLAALSKVLMTGNLTDKVEVDGDEVLVSELLSIITTLKPDLAPALEEYIGKQPARLLSDVFNFGLTTSHRLGRSIIDAGQSTIDSHAAERYLRRDVYLTFSEQLKELYQRTEKIGHRLTKLQNESNSQPTEPGATP
ncbi:MAG: hypothetical protein KUG75_10665 [Pseudomonadales bacterium]|nr:hypothetical protein [Pseudomonadales bacterium]